jgi:acyl dehydratase
MDLVPNDAASVIKRLPIGIPFPSVGRTIGEGEFSLAVSLIWGTNELHANRERMSKTQFGERLLPGPLVLSFVLGLASTSRMYMAMQDAGLRFVALLGIKDVRFPAPVLPGDTITAVVTMTSARASNSQPGRAVVTLNDRATNQDGKQVCDSTRFAFVEVIPNEDHSE